MRKSKIKILITALAIVSLILIASIVIIFIGKRRIDAYETEIDNLNYEIDSNKKIVYVAKQDIGRGDEIVEDVTVQKQRIYTGMDTSSYITEEDLGGFAVIDIKKDDPVYKNMVTSLAVTQDTREYEVSVASLMTDQKEHEYVDVRILFPNGEDYLILSKKIINNLSLEQCIFYTYLNEDEILRMASAIIDAYTVSGTRIYTTRYVEENLQQDATPTYLVKAETIDLINKDPNITKIATQSLNLSARMNLESRLKGLTEDQLKAVTERWGIADSAKNEVLIGNSYYVSNGTSVPSQMGEEVEEEFIPEDGNPEDTYDAYDSSESLDNTSTLNGNNTGIDTTATQGGTVGATTDTTAEPGGAEVEIPD